MAEAEAQSVALPPIVDLDALDTIREKLILAMESGSVVVDASAVERVATNALMMLMSADVTARQRNYSLTIENPSEPMTAAIERLGFGDAFSSFLKGH